MEETDGQQELGESHESLCGEGGPSGTKSTETGDENEVDDDIEQQASGGEKVELPEVSASGEEGAEDIGDSDGDKAEDNHSEGWYIEHAAARVEESHQWLGEERAEYGGT